jgi:dipeptidyl aminopeptidase/acylaminoacyl peptidase
VYTLQKSPSGQQTVVPNYTTLSGYTEEMNARPKVGSPQPTYETWIYKINADTTIQISCEKIPGIYDKPAFTNEYKGEINDKDFKPRNVRISEPIFSKESKALINVTAGDHKDRWIMTLDLTNGNLELLDRQHDDAWIAGPGIGWFSRPEMGWLDEETIWFKSEESGYAHLYSYHLLKKKKKALTSGNYEVIKAILSRNRDKFYLTTNEVSPHEHHFYHLDIKKEKLTKITSKRGGHEVWVSPDETKLAIRYAYSNQPWELFIQDNAPGAELVQITKSTTTAFDDYPWSVPQIVRFTADDGVDVPASLYVPEESKRNGAAIIFVHGAGYLQNVHYWWPSYYREYMFHHLLVECGYTVLAIDFRASAGYGRDWRTAIYRHMGGRDLQDQVDGAKYLINEHRIDPDRIGIYGGSYGGFITLMALFKSPGTFKSGAALRSVTDWAHYNHGYTSNILNTPVEDSLAFLRSSPIYHADGLQDNLLMLHGMIDRNVHFQDVVRLSQRLIELKKENWELAVFPLEGHGFVEATSWYDEYRRIYELFNNTLIE